MRDCGEMYIDVGLHSMRALPTMKGLEFHVEHSMHTKVQ